MKTWPSLGVSSPAIILNVVVFPQPEGPRRVTSEPASIVTDPRSTTAAAP